MKKLIAVFSHMALILMTISNIQAADLSNLAGAAETLQKGTQTIQAGQAAASAVQKTTATDLTGLLTQQLGVSQSQAEGGAGAIFQMAKSNMQDAAFSKVSSSVPGMQTLLAAAPAAKSVASGKGLGGLASMAGAAVGGNAGNLLGLAGSFQQLGLAPDMAQKFMPIVIQYVQESGGNTVSSALQAALKGNL